ncbi:MAG TPA: EscU/YscU/HrcU family type III secretion system export apparatus switch protein, partial [Aromatoleum sp.]|uniref:EscU/YscU/HrcU family type III secretion system export apparatus switch protein n=1 Tax=Aromatoleum sp. TaxID=2307007 RepID=UPI002B489A0F
MADDSDLEKTEQPSARRLEQARSEGQVPQSRELSTFLVLLAGVAGLWGMGGWMSARILGMLREGFHIERAKLVDQNKMLEGVLGLFMDTLMTMTPLFTILMVSAIAAPILM